MKKLKLITIITVIVLSFTSCTGCNWTTRNWGGKQRITLDPGQRLINMTWKQDDLWILVKYDTTKPQNYEFIESSNWGVFQGQITIEEK